MIVPTFTSWTVMERVGHGSMVHWYMFHLDHPFGVLAKLMESTSTWETINGGVSKES